jgi:hypothetical protein
MDVKLLTISTEGMVHGFYNDFEKHINSPRVFKTINLAKFDVSKSKK